MKLTQPLPLPRCSSIEASSSNRHCLCDEPLCAKSPLPQVGPASPTSACATGESPRAATAARDLPQVATTHLEQTSSLRFLGRPPLSVPVLQVAVWLPSRRLLRPSLTRPTCSAPPSPTRSRPLLQDAAVGLRGRFSPCEKRRKRWAGCCCYFTN